MKVFYYSHTYIYTYINNISKYKRSRADASCPSCKFYAIGPIAIYRAPFQSPCYHFFFENLGKIKKPNDTSTDTGSNLRPLSAFAFATNWTNEAGTFKVIV